MSESKKFNILIVDDEPKNIKLVASILAVIKEYQTAFAVNGKRALEMVDEESYDLILLDINMPMMDGYEVCNQLKADPKTQDIPIIYLTAMLDDRSIQKAFRSGAADYITKPVNKIELVSRIKTIFIMHQHQKEIQKLQREIAFLERVNTTSLNAQSYPILFHNKEKITLCNNELLHLFQCDNMSDFYEKDLDIFKLFYDGNCITKELSAEKWLYSLSQAENFNRVSIHTKEGLRHYLLNVERISDIENLNYIVFFNEINKPNFTFEAGKDETKQNI